LRSDHKVQRSPLPLHSFAAMLARRVMPQLRSLAKPSSRGFAAVGDKFPAVQVDFGFPPAKVNMAERLAGKKTIVVGLPGAFTPV